MLTFAQTITIVRRAIHAVAGTPVENIDQSDTLARAGIPDAEDGLRLVKGLVCTNEDFGVPKLNHSLDFNALAGIDTSSTVGDFALKIKANAKELPKES